MFFPPYFFFQQHYCFVNQLWKKSNSVSSLFLPKTSWVNKTQTNNNISIRYLAYPALLTFSSLVVPIVISVIYLGMSCIVMFICMMISIVVVFRMSTIYMMISIVVIFIYMMISIVVVFRMSTMIMMLPFIVMCITPVTKMFIDTVWAFFPFMVVPILTGISKSPFVVMTIFCVMTIDVVMVIFT